MKVARILPLLFSLLAIANWCNAQSKTDVLQQQINAQVWKPFCEAYDDFDAEKFNAVHTDDVIRATPGGIRIGKEYKDRNRENMAKNKALGIKQTIDLWFEHRVTNDKLSYEVGYYRVRKQNPGEEAKEYYGRFHCVIKKINGTWKIAQDWDDNEINGQKVTIEDWKKGKALKF